MKKTNLQKKNDFDGNLLYGVKKFNKKTSRDKHMKKGSTFKWKKFISKKVKSIKSNIIYSRPCPLCHNSFKRSKVLFDKDGFLHRKCSRCSLVYVSPVLNSENTHSFHLNENSFNQVYKNRLQIRMDNKKFNFGLHIIRKFLKSSNRSLIDIGCGTGGFIKLAKKNKWKVTGLEFNKFAIKKLTSQGFDIIENLNHKSQRAKYDCATLWNVLEHVHNPQKMLQDIQKILKPGGLILILVPNIDGLVNRILQKNAVAFAGYTHVNFFNHNTLSKILKINKFKTLHFETIFTEINSINNYLNFLDPYLDDGKKNLDLFTPEMIHKNFLGSKLLMIAKSLRK